MMKNRTISSNHALNINRVFLHIHNIFIPMFAVGGRFTQHLALIYAGQIK